MPHSSFRLDNVQIASLVLNVPPKAVFYLAAQRCRLKSAHYVSDVRWSEYERFGYDAVPAYVQFFCRRACETNSPLN